MNADKVKSRFLVAQKPRSVEMTAGVFVRKQNAFDPYLSLNAFDLIRVCAANP
jgi:hypothetical protein